MDKFKCNYNGMEKSFQNAAQMLLRKGGRRRRRRLCPGKLCRGSGDVKYLIQWSGGVSGGGGRKHF